MNTYHLCEVRPRPICKPRGAALAALVLLPIAGAAVGAGTHAQPALSFLAESVLAVDPASALTASPHVRSDAARYIAEIIKLPEVVAGARATAGTGLSVAEITREIHVVPENGPDIVRIDVHAASSQSAVALAGALALQAAGFVRQAVFSRTPGGVIVGDFEGSDDGWTGTSAFSSAPLAMAPVRGPAKMGAWYLHVVCPAVASCGPSVSVYTGFLSGSMYTAEAWVRSATGGRVRLVLGNSGSDVSVGVQTKLSRRWQRLTVAWKPRADTPTAELTLQTAGSRSQTYDVDDVSLLDPEVAGLPSLGSGGHDLARAFSLARSVTILPAREIAQTWHPLRTVAWAAIGALIGLATMLAAFGAGHAARSRQQAE